jgi:hypothetical protein
MGKAFQTDSYEAENVAGFDHAHTVPSLVAIDEVRLASWFLVSASARFDLRVGADRWIAGRRHAIQAHE